MTKPATIATLRDVARAAGVSPATVSRAFNAPGLLDEKTLERVRNAARDLRYQPNGIARSLRSQRSMVVGAVIQSLENASHIAGMIELCQSLLSQSGYTMLLAASHFDDARAVDSTRAMVRQGIDSLMLVNGDAATGVFPLLRESGVPYVAAWTPIRNEPSFGFDHRRAMRDLAGFLLDLGHRKFAAVFPFMRSNDRRRDRLRAIRDALTARGLRAEDCFVVDDCGFGIDDGRMALARILREAPTTTGVICANDNLAAGALLECSAQGMRAPEDISIAGYNDLVIAGAFEPAITTMRTPFAPVAKAMIDYLLARMAGEAPAAGAPLRPELAIRRSTGPAPSIRRRR